MYSIVLERDSCRYRQVSNCTLPPDMSHVTSMAASPSPRLALYCLALWGSPYNSTIGNKGNKGNPIVSLPTFPLHSRAASLLCLLGCSRACAALSLVSPAGTNSLVCYASKSLLA
jgi:hypothetical protein